MKNNPVGWFEIPVANMGRAIRFYETVFGVKLSHNLLGPLEMAMFPGAEAESGSNGSLVLNREYYKPSHDGVLLYFTVWSGDLSIELARVEQAGGRILVPRRQISDEFGFVAVVSDTEGNRIALHSHK